MKEFNYESEFYRFVYRDGILYSTYIGGPITLKLAKEIVKKRLELTEGEDVLTCVDVIKAKSIDRDARDYLASDAGSAGLKAGAIVTDSAFTKHLANFFLKIPFSKSKMPAKLFSNEEEAIKWLKQFK